jgi:glycosyltransferase involved in cell wall biosynthesis
MNSLISIIIPSFNSESYIKETLNSVIVQTYPNWECIIIDDGSNDDTILILKEYAIKDSRFNWFFRPSSKPKGPSSARNYGLENANGDFVVFLDSDDLLLNTCLENRIVFANENPDFDFWVFKTKMFIDSLNDNNKIINKTKRIFDDAYYLNEFLLGSIPFCITGPLWKKKSLEDLFGFDEKLNIFEDPDLHIRAYSKEYKSAIYHDSKADSFYRISNVNKFNFSHQKKIEKFNSAFLFFEKFSKNFSKQIQKNSSQFFKNIIFPNSDFVLNFRFYFKYGGAGFFNLKQIILLPFAIFFKALGISKVKGIGFYRFIQYIYR